MIWGRRQREPSTSFFKIHNFKIVNRRERRLRFFDNLEKEMKGRLADTETKEDSSAKTDSAEAGGNKRKLCIEFYESDADEKFDEVKREFEAYKSEPQLVED